MSNYRRSHEGRTFFFTLVTYRRRPILTTNLGRKLLREAIATVRKDHPFRIIALVLLPDHLHAVWELPRNDVDYSTRWSLIKANFSREWNKHRLAMPARSKSRISRGESDIWQRRFHEHTCEDDQDLKRCVDYVHVNPLKHELVDRVADWPWSTFHRFVKQGEYPPTWGNATHWYGDEFQHFE
jgi:putative transposase